MRPGPILLAVSLCALAGCASGTGPRPKVPLPLLLSADDYPASAMRNEEQGTTVVRVDVSPEGKPTDCWVVRSSGAASLDRATCRIIRSRARYHPALDRKRRPVAGSILNRIKWRIAGLPPPQRGRRAAPPPAPPQPPPRPRRRPR